MNNITYKETAIVICSYKNRTDILFKYINYIKDFDIYIVVRTNDYVESGYDKYVFNDNIHFLKSDNLHNVTDTRWFGHQEVMKLGYRGMIMIDDDIKGKYVYYIDKDHKRSTSNTYKSLQRSIEDLCKELVDKSNEYDAAFASPMFGNNIGFNKPEEIKLNKSLTCCAFTFHNLDICRQYNITYDINNNYILEDLDLVIQYMFRGLNCITLRYYGILVDLNTDKSLAVNGTNGYDKLIMNTYVKYRDYLSLYIKKSGILGLRNNWKLIYNSFYNKLDEQYIIDDLYHNTLYKYCKSNNAEMVKYTIRNKHKYEKTRKK